MTHALTVKSLALLFTLVSASFIPAQQQPAAEPAFEVASIRSTDPNPGNSFFIGMDADAGMVRYTNITLRDCIRAAFRVRDFQIQGPDWLTTARYQIDAKLASGASLDQIPEMLQTLLAERFGLTLRRDTKEQSVYALSIGRSGPKLKPAEVKPENPLPTAVGPDGKPRPAQMFRYSGEGVTLTAPATTLAAFVELMSRFTARPVVDMTGIEGQYQFELTFAPETTHGLPTAGLPGSDGTAASSEPAPSLTDAIRQYGLKIEVRKAPIEILTVLHVERTPTGN